MVERENTRHFAERSCRLPRGLAEVHRPLFNPSHCGRSEPTVENIDSAKDLSWRAKERRASAALPFPSVAEAGGLPCQQ
jgi:hypothetical protein